MKFSDKAFMNLLAIGVAGGGGGGGGKTAPPNWNATNDKNNNNKALWFFQFHFFGIFMYNSVQLYMTTDYY